MLYLIPLGIYPSVSGSPISSPLACLSPSAAILGTALPIAAAEFPVATIYTDFLNISAPGFSTYIPVTDGIPNSFCTASAIVAQATP